MSTWDTEQTAQFFQTILSLHTEDEARNFFRDLLTEKELAEFSNRWRAAQLLNQKVSYLQIEKETGLSSATIARISKWLKKGMGGYQMALDKQSGLK